MSTSYQHSKGLVWFTLVPPWAHLRGKNGPFWAFLTQFFRGGKFHHFCPYFGFSEQLTPLCTDLSLLLNSPCSFNTGRKCLKTLEFQYFVISQPLKCLFSLKTQAFWYILRISVSKPTPLGRSDWSGSCFMLLKGYNYKKSSYRKNYYQPLSSFQKRQRFAKGWNGALRNTIVTPFPRWVSVASGGGPKLTQENPTGTSKESTLNWGEGTKSQKNVVSSWKTFQIFSPNVVLRHESEYDDVRYKSDVV